jgi:hypothetical protein
MSVDADEGRPPRPTGTRERWIYGPGLGYAGLGLGANELRYISGVALLPPTALPSDFSARPATSQPRIQFSEVSRSVEERVRRPTHWPFVLDLGEGGETTPVTLQRLDAALDVLSEPVRAYLSASGVGGDPVFRLNAPLPPACVNPNGGRLKARPSASNGSIRKGSRPVVVAVIDDGIPFAHRNLLDAAGVATRLDYCWLQGAATDGALPYGRDLTGAEIDALRAAHGPDEDAIYARSGALDVVTGRTPSINRFGTHGSHVIDAAAGRIPGFSGSEIDDLRIITVQLPPAVTIDTTGFGKDAFILDALDYVILCAEEIAAAQCGDRNAPLPLFINISYGYSGGPHDGSSPLERGLRDRVAARDAKRRPTTLVMPSGNGFGARLHGQIQPEALNGGAPFGIPWRIQPTDRTPSYLEVWLPAAAGAAGASAFQVSVTAPDGAACATSQPIVFDLAPQAITALACDADILIADRVIGRCSVEMYNERWKRLLVVLAPTDPVDAALPAAPSGRWRVALQKTGGAPLSAPVSCRIQLDNDPYGYSRGGRQSAFDDPLDEAFGPDGARSRIDNRPNAFVRRLGTLNGIATHDKVTVVAGYYANTKRATEYAGAGPLRPDGQPPGPGDVHMSAVSDESTALRGVRAAGTRSGATIRLSGTSMAAPRATRRLALGGLGPLPPPPATLGPGELEEWPTRLGGLIET